MKITIYDLIKLIKEDKAPEKVLYEDNVYVFDKDCQDYLNSYIDEYLINEICIKIQWLDEEVEIIGQSEDEFTGCKWFVRGKETMSMEYEDSENWFKAKELIESLSSIEEKDIEEINEIIRFQDLATPYGHNEQMFMKFLIIHQNKIDELVKKVNKLKNNK